MQWMLAKPYAKNYKLCGEDMTLSFAASEHGFGTYAPQHPAQILSLWGSLPEFGWKYGRDENAISMNSANMKIMGKFLSELQASGYKCLLEENPDYLKEFSSVLGQSTLPSSKGKLLKFLKQGAKASLSFFGKKAPIFLGEREYSTAVCKLFDVPEADYKILKDEKNQVDLGRLFSFFRQYAIHIFFFDDYENLKPYLIKAGMNENVDFIDGRGLLVAVMD